jgi:hypothetical protein
MKRTHNKLTSLLKPITIWSFNRYTSNTVEDSLPLGIKYFTGRQEKRYKINFEFEHSLRKGTLR